MNLVEFFLNELDREAAGTRRVLERVPEGRNDWKPHEKSMRLGYLAALVADMPGWIDFMINRDDLDIAPVGGQPLRAREFATTNELLASLDTNIAKARATLSNTTEEHLLKPWKFVVAGHAVSEEPRYIMIRDAVFNHLSHHRGQLTVYLRLNEAHVPGIYGPSADEKMF